MLEKEVKPTRRVHEVAPFTSEKNTGIAPVEGTVRRLAEPAQVDPELLEQLRDAGVVPGAKGDYRFNEGYVLIQMEGKDDGLELPVELASHIFLVGEPA